MGKDNLNKAIEIVSQHTGIPIKDININSKAEDFDKVPEGGCKEICGVRMQCGHACESFCHNFIVSKNDDPDGHKLYLEFNNNSL